MHLSIYSVHSFIYLFIYLFIYVSIYLCMHLFIQLINTTWYYYNHLQVLKTNPFHKAPHSNSICHFHTAAGSTRPPTH